MKNIIMANMVLHLLVLCLYTLFSVHVFAVGFYRWVDKKGTVHFVDAVYKIPIEFRNQTEAIAGARDTPASKQTVFTFRPNSQQIIITAKLNGNIDVKLLLDMNSPQTFISSKTIASLGIDPKDANLPKVELEIAGDKTTLPAVKLESLDLQGRVQRPFLVAISDAVDNPNFVGSLGQDFLKNFKTEYDAAQGRLTIEEKNP